MGCYGISCFCGFNKYALRMVFNGILRGLNWIEWDSKEVSWDVIEFNGL